jgi:hypothetical protein
MSLNCGHQWAYCSSPKWCMSMERYGDVLLTRTTDKTERNLSQCQSVHHKSHVGLSRARTRASAVKGRRLTAWTMARSCLLFNSVPSKSETWKASLNKSKINQSSNPSSFVYVIMTSLQTFDFESLSAWPPPTLPPLASVGRKRQAWLFRPVRDQSVPCTNVCTLLFSPLLPHFTVGLLLRHQKRALSRRPVSLDHSLSLSSCEQLQQYSSPFVLGPSDEGGWDGRCH